MRHAQARQHQRRRLQAVEPLFEPKPPRQHHHHRKQEIAHRHVHALVIDRRPHKQPKLAGHIQRAQQKQQPTAAAVQMRAHKAQHGRQADEAQRDQPQPRRHHHHAQCKHIRAANRLHPMAKQIQHAKQQLRQQAQHHAFAQIRHKYSGERIQKILII